MNVFASFAIGLATLGTICINPLMAQEGSTHFAGSEPQMTAFNAVYAELATCLYIGSLSINYERMISPSFGLRVGLGWAWAVLSDERIGGEAMANFYTSGEHKLEIGAGVTVSERTPGRSGLIDAHILPAIAIGYRYQPSDGGLMFRVGGAWSYTYGFPFQISIGSTF